MKIAVAGPGYVGLSLATLLAQSHKVVALDIIPEQVEMINSRRSPIVDKEIERFFAEKTLDLTATLDETEAFADAEFVVVSTPTNYDPERSYFDTSSVETVIEKVTSINPTAYIVIKSTVPVGYAVGVSKRYGSDKILFYINIINI